MFENSYKESPPPLSPSFGVVSSGIIIELVFHRAGIVREKRNKERSHPRAPLEGSPRRTHVKVPPSPGDNIICIHVSLHSGREIALRDIDCTPSKGISFFTRLSFPLSLSVSAYTRCVIYKSIIAPHFGYCAILIISMSETQLGMLQRTQNRRAIFHCDKYNKTEHTLQFMSIKQRLCVRIFIYKILNNMLPVSLGKRIKIVGSERQTRQKHRVRITKN